MFVYWLAYELSSFRVTGPGQSIIALTHIPPHWIYSCVWLGEMVFERVCAQRCNQCCWQIVRRTLGTDYTSPCHTSLPALSVWLLMGISFSCFPMSKCCLSQDRVWSSSGPSSPPKSLCTPPPTRWDDRSKILACCYLFIFFPWTSETSCCDRDHSGLKDTAVAAFGNTGI